MEKDLDGYLKKLQEMLINKTYKTSEYETFVKQDGIKERVIYKLPYFPDRICQWAIMQVLEPIITRQFVKNTYSAIPNRGIHQCLNDVNKALRKDRQGTTYCLKMDINKYYPSISHGILKSKFRRIIKDDNVLWLLDEIIDSTNEDGGIPIGNYLSQYCGNFYLSELDHWLKEVKHLKYVYRYMDDIIVLHNSKEYLHDLRNGISKFLKSHLTLGLKRNWQIFPIDSRGIDFVGYRLFHDFILLRKRTCSVMKHKLTTLLNKVSKGLMMNYSEFCMVNSYLGWLIHCDSYRLRFKYFTPLKPYLQDYYTNVIKKGVIA